MGAGRSGRRPHGRSLQPEIVIFQGAAYVPGKDETRKGNRNRETGLNIEQAFRTDGHTGDMLNGRKEVSPVLLFDVNKVGLIGTCRVWFTIRKGVFYVKYNFITDHDPMLAGKMDGHPE